MQRRQLQFLVVAAAVVKLSQSIVPYITDGEFDIMIKTADLNNMITVYNQYFRCRFDGVFRELKKEFANLTLQGNHVNDDFIRHIIKGWSQNENVYYGIHGHQRRMPGQSLAAGIRAFDSFNWNLSANTTNFEQLYDDVCSRFKGIYFCKGPLTCYDVAMRIGQLFGIEPKDKVYLNCGALEGAKLLLKKKRLPGIIDRAQFPAPLCYEGSIYIEDILCTFKDTFRSKNDPKYRSVDEIIDIIKKTHSKGIRRC